MSTIEMTQPTTLSASGRGIDDAFAAASASALPSFAAARQAGWERYGELGMPTRRDERWRYTDARPIAAHDFGPVACTDEDAIAVASHAMLRGDAIRLVLANGVLVESASALEGLPAGLRIDGMARAAAAGSDAFVEALDQRDRYRDEPFAALNSALLVDGVVIEVAAGTVVDRPIHVVFATGGGRPGVSAPRVLIKAGANAQATVVEEHLGAGDAPHLVTAVTEIVADAGANIEHATVQNAPDDTVHLGSIRIHATGRDARVTTHAFALGGQLVRNTIDAALDAEGCDVTCNGLLLTEGRRHVDSALRIDHLKPHCTSWQYYKGILEDRSSASFAGRIFVEEHAQKTDAKQTNMNLLLSEHAHVETRPQLEIFADDVKCTHGATIGQIEPSQLFYLQARGISRDAARTLLVYAFANEVIAEVKHDELRRSLERELVRRLPAGAMLRGLD